MASVPPDFEGALYIEIDEDIELRAHLFMPSHKAHPASSTF